jgi:hypothetical protein
MQILENILLLINYVIDLLAFWVEMYLVLDKELYTEAIPCTLH